MIGTFFKNRENIFRSLLLFLLASAVGMQAAFAGDQKPFRDFTLKDTHDKTVKLSELHGTVVVLSFIPDTKDKKRGAEWLAQSRKWMNEINRNFEGRLTIIGLKEVTRLPVFLPKSMVRMKLRREPFPYLIDWTGDVFERFSVNNKFTLMLLDKKGREVYRLSDPFNSDTCRTLCAEIGKLLGSGSNSAPVNTAPDSYGNSHPRSGGNN